MVNYKLQKIMRRTVALIMLSLLSLCVIKGEGINDNDKWFDGSAYYISSVTDDGYLFSGVSADDTYSFEFILKKGPEEGKYYLLKGSETSVVPFRVPYESVVEYNRRGSNRVLTILNEKGNVSWTLVGTDKSHQDCLATEFWAKSQPLEKMCSDYIMNTHYLSVLSKSQLRYMYELIEKDSSKSYVELINMSLIESELEVPDFQRANVGDLQALAEAQAPDIVRVSTAEEFLNSIGSNRIIIIEEGARLNLSELIMKDSFLSEKGRVMGVIPQDWESADDPMLISEWVVDGNQLTLFNIKNLTISAENYAHIEVDFAYAFVLNFLKCENIRLENLILGHTVEGFCEGGVVGTTACNNITIVGCDLYGCGTYGLCAYRTSDIIMENSIIRDCSYGILQLFSCDNVLFSDCRFYRNREFTMVEVDSGCSNVLFKESVFSENHGVLFGLGSRVELQYCRIIHNDLDKIGANHYLVMDENSFIQYANY